MTISNLDTLTVVLCEPFQSPASPLTLAQTLIERLGQAIGDLDIYELRIELRSPWFEWPHAEATAIFLEDLRRDLAPLTNLQLFALLEPEQFTEVNLAAVRQSGVRSILAFPKEGREPEEWNAHQELYRSWRRAVEAQSIHPPIARIEVDPRANVIEIFEYLKSESMIRSFDIRLPGYSHRRPPENQLSRYYDQLMELFQRWIEDDNPNVSIQFFHDILLSLKFGGRIGWSKWSVDAHQSIFIDGKGAIYHSREDISLGEAIGSLARPIATLFASELFEEIQRATVELPSKCAACAWAPACGGGELAHRKTALDSFDRESVYCEALEDVLASLAASLINAGMPPETIEYRMVHPIIA